MKEASDGEQISEPGQTETPGENPDESEKNDTEQPDNGGTDNAMRQNGIVLITTVRPDM